MNTIGRRAGSVPAAMRTPALRAMASDVHFASRAALSQRHAPGDTPCSSGVKSKLRSFTSSVGTYQVPFCFISAMISSFM